MTRLVLLGSGHAHLQVLRALEREPLARAQVTLVSPFPRLVYSGMVPGVVAGHYSAGQCTIAIAPLAGRAGAALVEAAAIGLDAAARKLHLTDGRELGYDMLSVDVGAVIDRDCIPGAREHALFVRPIEGLIARWPEILDRAGCRALDLVVIGGGAAGFELALAMQHRLGARARASLVSGAEPLLATYPAAVRRLALRALKRRGVALVEQACCELRADSVLLEGGERLRSHAAVLATGGVGPQWLGASGLALDERGFITTGATLQSTSHREVFAAGDVASRIDAPRPRSGVYAVRAGPPLALNLRRFIDGAALERYRPQSRSLNLLACGERHAIASWGNFAAEGRWAWRWKDRIDRGFVEVFAQPAQSRS